MPHVKRQLTQEDAAAINQRRITDGASWDDIKIEFGISTATARRLLTEHGFDHSADKAARVTEKWDRPCLCCGSREVRSRGLFRCKSCRHDGRSLYNAGDSMYAGYKSGS